MVRFLHTADWQLAARLTQCGERASEVRAQRLKAARRVIDLANEEEVDFLLIAGDLFDGHDVDEVDVKRCVDLLNELDPTPIYVLPGNHDPLVPGGVWDRSSWKRCGEHIHLLQESAEIECGDQAVLYACPLNQKQSTKDPTSWIPPREEGDSRVRIGVAHGALDVLPEAAANFPIDPNRADHAGLDYLALGDWHGYMEHGSVVYPGTIEPGGFGEADPGHVAIVTIEEAGTEPTIEKQRVALLTWQTLQPAIHDQTDVEALEREIRDIGDLGSLVLRIRPSFPDPVGDDAIDALDTLRKELEEEAFFLHWDETAAPPLPGDAELELPDGLLKQIDEDLAAILDGRIPEGPGQKFAAEEPETVALARRTLHRITREVRP